MHTIHELTVSSVEKHTPETVLVTLDVPEALSVEFTYNQGQHLTLRKNIDGQDVRRSYSICSSVADTCLKVAVRRVEGGRFSTYANEHLKAGDTLEVLRPAGHFYVDLEEGAERTYVAFASGSGITPIMSIIKTTLETEPNAKFLLFYGNRTKQSTIFLEEIALLKNRFMDRFSYWHFLSQEDPEVDFFKGRLNGKKIAGIFDRIINVKAVDHAFICGPEAMIDDIVTALGFAGLSDEKIHFEKFLSEGKKNVAPKRTKEALGLASMTLVINGDENTVKADKDIAILDAAIEQGFDVPFACKGGVCCTCRAKVLDGDVEMVLNQGLEPEEVAAGYVLTCQSFAVSDKVVLSYDE